MAVIEFTGKRCAPVAEEEEASIRSEHVRTQVANDLFLEENRRMSAKGKEVAARCPDCGEPTLGKKFCPGCGGAGRGRGLLRGPRRELGPGARFCGECGAGRGPSAARSAAGPLRATALLAASVGLWSLGACGGASPPGGPATPAAVPSRASSAPAEPSPVHVVLFTHIEDNTPPGALGTPASRTAYLNLRARLLELAAAARAHGVQWSLQPDWKFLLAALEYEDAAAVATTGGVNALRYVRDVQGAAVDPHSHENGGYNYTDVAHLLALLGVGGSTVIGGHIWDPTLPQFQEWDRFRAPVRGLQYPAALWRGDILMGSGTPNHVNDPVISGVWRPADRFHYFEDDPAGNIACVGAFRADLPGVSELVELYRAGAVDAGCMLTASYHVRPADLMAPGGVAAVERGVIAPLAALQASGRVALTDFTGLVAAWRQRFGGRACTYVPAPR